MSEFDSIQRWRSAMQAGTAPPADRRDCPASAELAILFCDPASAPRGLLDHVERCSACARELASLGDLPELDRMVGQMARRPVSRSVPLAAAACLVLAIGLASYLLVESPRETVIRNVPTSAEINPQDGAVLDHLPEALTWSNGDDQRSRLVLYDAEARRLWTSEAVESGRVELPDPVRESLGPGVYYWQVQIVDSGTVRGPYAFEVSQAHEP